MRRAQILVGVVTLVLAGLAPSRAFEADPMAGTLAFDEVIAAAKAQMMTAPQDALEAAVSAEAIAKDSEVPDAVAMSLWLQAEALNRLNQPERARAAIDRAAAAFGGSDEKLRADIYLARGRIARVLNDYATALESFQTAYTLFHSLEIPRSEALALQGLGTLFESAHQHERVIEYNERAAEAFSDGAMLDLVSLNNRANAYRELGDFDAASQKLSEALVKAEGTGSALLQVRILENIALLEIRRGDLDAAQAVIDRSFAFIDSPDIQNWLPYLWGAKGLLLWEQGDLRGAEQAMEAAFKGVDLETTTAHFRDFHDGAHQIYAANGDAVTALAHLRAFKRLDDEGRDVAASANMALLNAQFESNTKALEISRLRTETLEQEAHIREAQATQRVIMTSAGGVVVLLLLSFFGILIVMTHRRAKIVQAFNNILESKNKELLATNSALQEANQVKTEFLATTSHEIRTPLNAIIGIADVLLKSTQLSDEHRDFIRMIHTAGENLLEIVNDVLDVAKLEAGKLDPVLTPTNVADIVDEVASIWCPTVEKKGLTYAVEIDPQTVDYVTDGRFLRQILSNLISNAAKFTASGCIIVSLSANEDGFSIAVSDTGAGIDPSKHELIFEAFRQADQSLKRNFEGTGLGLAICAKLTAVLGGRIELDSALGKGSTFRLVVPAEIVVRQTECATPPVGLASIAQGQPAATPVCLDNLRVLIAEDNPANAMVLQAYLKGRCRSVEVVGNGSLAVDAVKRGQIDLVLMDKRMPVMSGIDATQAIRALPGSMATIPIIAVTADIYEGAEKDALACGMNDYISKPLNAQELFLAIERAIGVDDVADGKGGMIRHA